jgi:hypothetical protein
MLSEKYNQTPENVQDREISEKKNQKPNEGHNITEIILEVIFQKSLKISKRYK